MEKMFMNPVTGSVDTMENWAKDYLENTELWKENDLYNLIEVKKDSNNNWVEA